MEILRTEAKIWTRPSLRKAYISVDENWFQTYAMDTIGPLIDCYVENTLDDSLIDVISSLAEKYKVYIETE